jgi:hypothetical protein
VISACSFSTTSAMVTTDHRHAGLRRVQPVGVLAAQKGGRLHLAGE